MSIRRMKLLGVMATLAAGVLALTTMPSGAQSLMPTALDEIGKSGTVKIGWTAWYPYHFRDPKTKEITGASARIVEEIAKALNVKLELVEDSASTAIAGLQSGKFQMFGTPMAITLPRARAVTYTEPFLQNRVGVAVRKSDLEQYKSWRDVDRADIKSCVVLGSNVDTWSARVFSKTEILRVKEMPFCVQELKTRKAHTFLTSYDTFAKMIPEHPDLAVVPGEPWMTGKVGYLVKQGDYPFRDWLNAFFDEFKRTGELVRILKEYGLDESFVQY